VPVYDAVVIGLGPAGSASLRRLQELGVKSIGIERKKEPENPVVCEEYLPFKEDIVFITKKPSVKKAYEYIEKAQKLNIFSGIEMRFKGGKKFFLKIRGFTVDRKEMVKGMLEGAEYYTSNMVTKITKVGSEYVVKTNKGLEFTAKNIVVADGYPSTSRRLLGTRNEIEPINVAVGLNVKMETPSLNNDIVYMYSSPHTEGGYAWIIPFKDEISNVGIGIRFNYIKSGVNIVQRFNEFLKEDPWNIFSHSKILERPKSRWIPVSGFYGEPVLDRVFFVGDALGAVNPINGGGIFTSMALGILAADAIWLENPKIYEERSWSEVGSILKIGKAYRKVVDFVYENWSVGSLLLRLVPQKLMEKIIKGEKTFIYSLFR